MKPNFEKTVNILVNAYMNDTLAHGYCTACAVGNIVAHSLGLTVVKRDEESTPDWSNSGLPYWPCVFLCTGSDPKKENFQVIYPEAYKKPEVKKEIDATGYSWMELALIERAFESVPQHGTTDKRMFDGLMAVVDVLAEIHNIDLTTKEEAKLLFAKP